jgi:salicylate hydroxylase
LAECIGRAKSTAEIPAALQAYERIQKPRAEKIKRLAEISGAFKTLGEGPEQKKRDSGFEERMQRGPKFEFWRASGALGWIYEFDFKEIVSQSDLPIICCSRQG